MSGNASMTGKHMRAGGEVSRWRNSSIELLRIVAMLMIIGHHYVVHCGGFNNPYPPFGEAINGRLETLRGNAMGFANTTSYIQRCLIHSSQLKDILTH